MENENQVVTPKKSKKTKVIVIVIIVLIALAIGGYFAYNSLAPKKDEKKTAEVTPTPTPTPTEEVTEPEETEAVETSKWQKYVDYISPISITSPSAALYNVSGVEAKNLSPRKKIEYIGSFVYQKSKSSSDYAYDILTEADVKKAVEEVYGPGTYQRTTFNLGCGDYNFNSKDGKYYSKTGCGGTSAFYATNEIINTSVNSSKLVITTAYVFVDMETNKYYKDYNRKVALGDYNNSEDDSAIVKFIKDNKDKLNHIIYTYESTDGTNYYFTGFKNTK